MFMLSLVIRKFRGRSAMASALVLLLLWLLLLAIAGRVSLLATCQTRLIQQRRANQFAFWSRSRFQVMRAVFSFSLPRIKAYLAKGFAFLAAVNFGLFGGHFCVHSCLVVHCLTMLHPESNSIFLETRCDFRISDFSDFGFFGFFKLWNKGTLLPKTGNGLFTWGTQAMHDWDHCKVRWDDQPGSARLQMLHIE